LAYQVARTFAYRHYAGRQIDVTAVLAYLNINEIPPDEVTPPATIVGGAYGEVGQRMGTVLVIDDDRDIRGLLRYTLQEEGWAVLEAANGREGLDRLRASSEPLVALLDYRMPYMDGFDVLRAVAANNALAARHAYLLITANPYSLPSALPELAGTLGVPILGKPFDLDDLCTRIQHAHVGLAARHISGGADWQPLSSRCA
jgi:CheY-like chemotaxis protein